MAQGREEGQQSGLTGIWTWGGVLAVRTLLEDKCPRCGKNQIVQQNGRTKKWFTGCSSWPRCNWSKDGVDNMSVALKTDGARNMKIEVGKFIKYETQKGTIVGTVVGKNDQDNFVLRIHKLSPVSGWKPGGGALSSIEDCIDDKYSKNIDKHTYWFLAPTDEVEEATENDLMNGPSAGTSSQKKTEGKMADKKNAVQIIKSDAHEAAFRVAGKRLSQGAQQVVTKAVSKLVPAEHKESAEAIMQTEAGLMLTQMMLGWGLVYAPGVGQDPRLQKLATEFRVQATEKGMDMVVGGLLEHLQPVLNDALSLLPGAEQATGTRVGTLETAVVDAETQQQADEEEAEVVELPKRQTAGK